MSHFRTPPLPPGGSRRCGANTRRLRSACLRWVASRN